MVQEASTSWIPTSDDAEIKFFEHETGDLKPTGVRMSEYLSLADEIEEP